MKILVVGAGATGGYFGARLAQAGQDVTFLVRPRRAAALRERGLRIIGPAQPQEETITPRLLTADELPTTSPYDLILLSVKSTALKQALDDIAPAVGPDTAIVPFLNGMAHLDELNSRFGTGPVLGGVAKVVTTVDTNGDIVRLAPLAAIALGEQDGSDSPRTQAIHAALTEAGITTTLSPAIVSAMWHKWVFISTLSATTILMRGSVDAINAVPGGPQLGPAILAEAAAVSSAAGHPVPERELAATTGMVTQTGTLTVPSTSMFRDVESGFPTEVEQIFADLTARARIYGVPTPLLDLTTMQLRVHEKQV
ncbi:ketopantoate reductase family protein [Streptomyces sp. NPDC050738]|uniref:ketopantoate reductase family protein n=1 Tax=Streptomyces sp. NPDC050738 TaxID=3154744 RepID=UPI003430C643